MNLFKSIFDSFRKIPERSWYLFETFILWSSGVNIDIIRRCKDNSKNKFISIGLVIIFTGFMAAVTAAMTLSFAYPDPEQNHFVIFGGILWGIGIFIIDRLAVSSMNIDDTLSVKIFSAIPRIILASAIAYVIVIPLKLELFKEEIDKEIAEIVSEQKVFMVEGNFKDKRTEIQSSSDSLQKIIDLRKTEIERLINIPVGQTNVIRLTFIGEKLIELKKLIQFDKLNYEKLRKDRQVSWSLYKSKERDVTIHSLDIIQLEEIQSNLGCEDLNNIDKPDRKKCRSIDVDILKLKTLKTTSKSESDKYFSQWQPKHTRR